MIPMYVMFPHNHMGPQPFGMFPAPCVPFQQMPGQPSSNVAQPPPTQPQVQKNESHLPSREEETIRSLPSLMWPVMSFPGVLQVPRGSGGVVKALLLQPR